MKKIKQGFPSPLSAAISQLGIQEATGNNDGIPAKRYMRGDRLAWCAGFVLWSYDHGGAPIYKSARGYYPLRNVATFSEAMKRQGSFFGRALVDVIRPGDIVFFSTRGRSDAGIGGHVGIVESIDVDAGRIHTIEGNTSNAVLRRSYPVTSKRITGYARP